MINKHIRGNILIMLGAIVIRCVLVPVLINTLFEIIADSLLKAKWKAEDSLAYSAFHFAFFRNGCFRVYII